MEKTIALLRTQEFWVSVVLFGLLINVIAFYLIRYMEEHRLAWSAARRKKLRERHLLRWGRIMSLSEDAERMQFTQYDVIRRKLSAAFLLIVAILLHVAFPLGTWAPTAYPVVNKLFDFVIFCLGTALPYPIAMYLFSKSLNEERDLRDAEELRKENRIRREAGQLGCSG